MHRRLLQGEKRKRYQATETKYKHQVKSLVMNARKTILVMGTGVFVLGYTPRALAQFGSADTKSPSANRSAVAKPALGEETPEPHEKDLIDDIFRSSSGTVSAIQAGADSPEDPAAAARQVSNANNPLASLFRKRNTTSSNFINTMDVNLFL